MESLPTPVTTENLNSLLATLEGLATVEVTRHADVIKATAVKRATGKRERILSAVTRDGKHWHVMTVPGLVQASFEAN